MNEMPVGSWWVVGEGLQYGPSKGSLFKVQESKPMTHYTLKGWVKGLEKSPRGKVKMSDMAHYLTQIPPVGWVAVPLQKAQELDQQIQQDIKKDFTQFIQLAGGYGGNTGTDPEIFATTKGGEVIPSWKFLPSKAESEDKIYWDGWQGEFEVPSFGCIASGMDTIQRQLVQLQTKLRQFDPSAKLVGDSVLPVAQEDLQKGAKEHIQFGCMPSKNVYGDGGASLGDPRELPVRFAGFHIHQSTKLTDQQFVEAIKLCDALAGVLSVVVFQGLERPERRQFYGLAGEWRQPAYGLEYRVISSAVMWHPAMAHLMFNMVRSAVRLVEKGLQEVWVSNEDEVREAINTLDVTLAKRILLANQSVMEKMIHQLYIDTDQPTLSGCEPFDVPEPKSIFEDLLLRGVKQFIELDVEKNWHLSNGLWVNHSEGPGVMMWRFAKEALK
jgi:hypothetical protein